MKTLSEFNIYEELFTKDNMLKEGISLGKLGKKIASFFGGKSKDKKTTEEKKEITTYKYEPNFDSLNDEDLLRYVRDDVYSNVVESIPDGYYVDNVDTAYISQEYLDELEYNSKSNVFFGYSLKDIESVYD